MKNQFDTMTRVLTICFATVAMMPFAAVRAEAQASGIETSKSSANPNTLTADEVSAGWHLLWDGKTSEGWRSAGSEKFPTHGWAMKDGVLAVQGNSGEESKGGGDIITKKRYSNFELVADFKITPGANSGIKIFVQPNLSPIDKVTGAKTGVGSA